MHEYSCTLDRGTRTGLIDSVLTVAGFVILTGLHALDTHATVKLLSENLILLAETIKFASQVTVLNL